MKITQNFEQKVFSVEALGYSMTHGIMPEIIREDGIAEELTAREGSPRCLKEYFLYFGSNGDRFSRHIDVDSTAFTFVYDLKALRKVEHIYISCFFRKTTDYSIGEFELYGSNSREDLFNEENKILYYDNRNKVILGDTRNNSDFYFDTQDLNIRYFAFRQLNTNSKDGMSRIKNICLYGDEYSHQRYFLSDLGFVGSVLDGLKAEVEGEIEGCACNLTNNVALDDTEIVKTKNATFNYSLKKASKINHIVLLASGIEDIKVKLGDEFVEPNLSKEETESSRTIYSLKLESSALFDKLSISVSGNAEIDQILAYSLDRKVTVSSDVITEDFIGVGANVIATHLFESSRMLGFTEPYMELEKRRICAANPAFIRLWFQVDWFVMDEDGYINRKYVFNSPKMQALFKELDAYKEAGIEVELNYGWKIGYSAQSWFSFPDVYNKTDSAPRDLEHFATSCSDCLKELIINRGYDNIKYLSFFNESNAGEYPYGWDFLVPEGYDALEYWNKMMVTVDSQLKKDGLRHLVKIWAAETSGAVGDRFEAYTKKWLEYIQASSADKFDCASFHLYHTTYDEAIEHSRRVLDFTGNRPAIVTEYATYRYGKTQGVDFDFEKTNMSSTFGFINGGLSGMAFWILSGVFIDEHILLNNSEATWWQFPTEKVSGVNAGTRRFSELSLFTNYMPRHSKVISTLCSDEGMHAAAIITPDGDYTIAVELKDEGKFNRNIEIKLPENVNKKFHKFVYNLDCETDGNLIIPPSCGEFEGGDSIKDVCDGKYNLIFYTTMKPRTQVVMDPVEVFVKPGETVQLKAHIIDGEGELKWSIPDYHCNIGYPGSITPDGIYTADSRVYKESVACGIWSDFAVKAEAENGEYGIVMIKVRK